MLDAVFLAATAALFALVALVAKGVEKLGPDARPASPHALAPRPRRASDPGATPRRAPRGGTRA